MQSIKATSVIIT